MSCGKQQEERYIPKETLKRFPAVEARGASLSPVRARSSSTRPFWKKLSWNRPQSCLHGDPVTDLAALQKSRSRKDIPSPRRGTEPTSPRLLPSLFGAAPSLPTTSREAPDLGWNGGLEENLPVHELNTMMHPSLSADLLGYLATSTSMASLQSYDAPMEIVLPDRPETSPHHSTSPHQSRPRKLPALEAKNENTAVPRNEETKPLTSRPATKESVRARSKTPKGTREDEPKAPISEEKTARSKSPRSRTGRLRNPNKLAFVCGGGRSDRSDSSRSPVVSRSSSKKPRPKPVNQRATVTEDWEEILVSADDDELKEEPVVRIRERSASNFVAKQRRRSTAVEYKNEFQYLLALMRRHNLSIDELRAKRSEFNGVDGGGCGVISKAEFHQLVRKRCGYGVHEPVAEHLIADHWLDESAQWMDFEMYLLWSLTTAYSEEFMVSDPKERHLRQVARTNQITDYLYVEKVKHVFDSFDEDHSDHIDESEFEKVIYVLMNARHPSDISPQMLKRFWREVDTDGSGEITFEEFLLWYFKFMGDLPEPTVTHGIAMKK